MEKPAEPPQVVVESSDISRYSQYLLAEIYQTHMPAMRALAMVPFLLQRLEMLSLLLLIHGVFISLNLGQYY